MIPNDDSIQQFQNSLNPEFQDGIFEFTYAAVELRAALRACLFTGEVYPEEEDALLREIGNGRDICSLEQVARIRCLRGGRFVVGLVEHDQTFGK